MNRKILVLVNPISGRGAGRIAAEALPRIFEELDVAARVELIPGPGGADEIVKRAGGEFEAVVAVGGDGTVGEVAGAVFLHGLAKPVGLIPLGLSNCLARHLNLPFDMKRAAAVAARGNTSRIDLAFVDGKTVLSFLGAGFDASVVDKVARARKGAVSDGRYVGAAIRTAFREQWAQLEVEIDGRLVEGTWYQAIASAVTNYAHYFSLPRRKGFQVYLFKGTGIVDASRTLARSGLGRDLAKAADVSLPVGERLVIRAKKGGGFYQYDGEAGGPLPVDCRIEPQALDFLAP
jgi:diacylglycerol kinase family enzyme